MKVKVTFGAGNTIEADINNNDLQAVVSNPIVKALIPNVSGVNFFLGGQQLGTTSKIPEGAEISAEPKANDKG